MEIQIFELGNPEGRGAQAVLEIQVDGGGGVGGWSMNNPLHLLTSKYAANEYSSLRTIHKIYAVGKNNIYAYSIYIYIHIFS